jgi:predicted dehydrogenase
MAKTQYNIGIIGVGNISPAYIKGCRAFDILNLVACADLDVERARKVAAENNIPKAYSVDELLSDPEVDIVINLTIPNVHAEVSLKILNAGKHVYSEKPLATRLEEGKAIIDLAASKGLRVGCAPDTFLFGQHQTARKLLDEGIIGESVAAVAFMMSHGPEGWHPNPDFYYAPGGGPMFDMGPYYLTCLVNLFGPAVRVSGTARSSFANRTAKDGHNIDVKVPTHYTGIVEFASGVSATIIQTFDVWANRLPQLEVYGALGTLTVPDPNGYNPRETTVHIRDKHDWEVMPITHREDWARGIGLADMAYGIRDGRAHRASGDLAYHVLEIMSAFETAYNSGTYVQLTSTVERPEPLPVGLAERVLE